MVLTFAEVRNTKSDGRSREQIFQSIVNSVKARSPEPMLDEEAHQAAHNLIAFIRQIGG